MTEVINIRFRNTGKVYFFAPNGISVQPGDFVIVETSKGLEYGECTAGNHEVNDSAIVPPLRPVIRVATEEDKRISAQNHEKEAKAFNVCLEKIVAHNLDMKLVDVEYSFEGNKILFFFTSDGRVDFRELVKDLVSIFRARIELRQIGVRDGAKMLGGLGICGRPFCCSEFLEDFHPVSIKMAKTQSLSLNPTKISGTCGRLMCCLKYEQDAYEDLIKSAPKVSASVVTPFGQGTVIEVNLLRQFVKVRVDEGDTTGIQVVPFCDIGKTVSSAPKNDDESDSALPNQNKSAKFENTPDYRRNAPSREPRPEFKKNSPSNEPRPEFRKNLTPNEPRPEFRKNLTPNQPKPDQNAQNKPRFPRPISELLTGLQNETEKIEKKKPFNKNRFIKRREPDGNTPIQGAQTPTEGVASKKPGGNKNSRRRRNPKPPEVS